MLKLCTHKGFSAVEAIIVICIIAIASAVAIPFLARYVDNNRLRAAAEDIATDIMMTREYAISTGNTHRISFTVSGTTYTIEQPPGTVIQTKDLAGNNASIRITAAGFGAGTAANITARGTVDPTGSITIENKRGSTAVITSNITGKTHVIFNMQ